ncbi:helix-turn-helix domain-containing protein [Arthrobacter sp. 260]|uniref:GlxA family transcriptional regulator n=1 Tax=Arthrobacter sp. 260 TaxID=2735314 RepID=UPI001492DE55|nr:helix-turn-helix domain-containing protein [Arthrobacter sp. 260]NOJ60595.1 helix-turn-helix domain-containing protein [Arthrobacter sp. 260]
MLKNVAAVVLPGVTPFEFGVVCEVFGEDRTADGVPPFDFRICAESPGMVPTSLGFAMEVGEGLGPVEVADLVVVCPYDGGSPVPPAVISALRQANERGAWILSVCSGAFLLAEAGLLDGRRAATHWKHSQRLAQSYPDVIVDEDVLYVHDGNIITSAGSAAGVDACLHLVRTELGSKAANTIARGMVVPPHRDGGQAQYIERPFPAVRSDTMEHLLVWLADHLEQDLPVSALAARMHMSERTFARRFRAETGATPAAWVNSQRLLRAQALLEDTELSIDAVATKSGFGQSVLLRHHFHRALGISPAGYRRTFRGKRVPQAAVSTSARQITAKGKTP